ncbi:MFS transporter [Paraburkholderia sp. Ac-20336]|uniref:MFS transporter n=1 Tax=Paraburkholderia sp. Ac-20336 TaxID=2703886 RepID=UPI001981B987|nr:MFS transporter [Paraburkholderia sp. Ac-20336]MBN3803259.1 MFS transporter [Paraburkholderia sp. Ac-20336]
MKADAIAAVSGLTDAQRTARLLFRIENVPFCRWHTRARIVMGSATFFDAFDALSLAFVLPVLVSLWHLNHAQVGFLIAAGYAGQVIGALFFGWLAERAGRVPGISIAVALMSAMSIACAFAGNFPMLFALRFLQGIGVGGEVPIAAAYINELSQAKGRGRFFILYELIFPLGLLAAAQVGSFVVPTFGWRYMFLVGGIPGLLILLFMVRLPESPRWLAARGRFEQADAVIAGLESSTPRRSLDPQRDHAEIEARLQALIDVQQSSTPQKGSWKEMFSPVYLPRTLVVWVLWASSYFVANGINNWLPTLYRTVYHLPLQQSLRMASITNVLSTCAVLVCALLVDRVGRRHWTGACFLVSGALLALLAALGARSPWSVAILASSAYAVMGTTTVLLYLYTPEIYPTRMRAIGTGLATSWLRVASAVAPVVVGVVLSAQGIGVVFLMFAAATVVGLLTSKYMIETSNRALEEISP